MEVTTHPDHHYLIHQTHLWLIITVAMIGTGLLAISMVMFPNNVVSKYGLNVSPMDSNRSNNKLVVTPLMGVSGKKLQASLNSVSDVYGSSISANSSRLGNNLINSEVETKPAKQFSAKLKTN